jgi:predicted acetyltransferase
LTEQRIEIRRLTRAELPASFALSEFAFQYEMTAEEREERLLTANPLQTWGYWIDGKLASKLTILDHHTWIGGRLYAMGGIASVATWPEYRRQGQVGKLLRHALLTMKEQGQTISFLAPFDYSFYRRYGWEALTEYRKYSIETAKLSGVFQSGPGRVERVQAEPSVVGPVYEAYAKSYNGMLQRADSYWHEQVFKKKKGTVAVYCDAACEARGYVLYQVRERVCKVHELVALDEEAYASLWKFIADHDSMTDRVELQAPADDRLPWLLPNPRFAQETVPYFMARIVDVAGFVRQYPFLPGDAARFRLRVRDGNAGWNDGLFLVHIGADGAADARKLDDGAEPAADFELEADIQTLSTLLVGYQPADWLHRTGRLGGDAAAVRALAARLPRRTTYLADFF